MNYDRVYRKENWPFSENDLLEHNRTIFYRPNRFEEEGVPIKVRDRYFCPNCGSIVTKTRTVCNECPIILKWNEVFNKE